MVKYKVNTTIIIDQIYFTDEDAIDLSVCLACAIRKFGEITIPDNLSSKIDCLYQRECKRYKIRKYKK